MSTTGNDEAGELDASALRIAWCERAAADEALASGAHGLLVREDADLDEVIESVLARSTGATETPATVVRTGHAALAAGRAAFTDAVDLAGLQRLFGHLQDVVTARLLRHATDDDGQLSAARAEQAASRVRDALAPAVVEATRGWFDEAGRKLRHDVKTPLQATSLNLELLTLESAERGLDTEALDTIQRSLDQVVELLARAEPAQR